jgi:hypothetical protein
MKIFYLLSNYRIYHTRFADFFPRVIGSEVTLAFVLNIYLPRKGRQKNSSVIIDK